MVFHNAYFYSTALTSLNEMYISIHYTFRPLHSRFRQAFSDILTIYNRHPTYHILDHLWFASPRLYSLGYALSRLHRALHNRLITQTVAYRSISAGASGRYSFISPVGLSVLPKLYFTFLFQCLIFSIRNVSHMRRIHY